MYCSSTRQVVSENRFSHKSAKRCFRRIAPRSHLALDLFIGIGGEVVDTNYQENVTIVVFNLSPKSFVIRKRGKIAPSVCKKIAGLELKEVSSLDTPETGSGNTPILLDWQDRCLQ